MTPAKPIVDLPRPIKQHGEIGKLYKEFETGLMRVIAEKFNLPVTFWKDQEVQDADNALLIAEARDLLPSAAGEIPDWAEKYGKPWKGPIVPAEDEFLYRFKQLTQ